MNAPTPLRTEPAPRSTYEQYEQRKSEWVREHPEATPAEYERAMQQIAKEREI